MADSQSRGFLLTAKRLAKRDASVMSEWNSLGLEDAFVKRLLRCVQTSLGYSTWHFCPNDNLAEIVDDESYEFASCELLQSIHEELGVDLLPCEPLKDGAATIGLLAQHAWQKRASSCHKEEKEKE
ncbi:MAG: hypothetical protein V4719_29200 [Planctomycetota bacterium]